MIFVGKLLCDCGTDITNPDAAVALPGGDLRCQECATEWAREVIGSGAADAPLRARAIELLAIDAARHAPHVPKEMRS